MLSAFNTIIGELSNLLNYYYSEASTLVIALALIMSIIRALNILIVQGYDQFIPGVKKQMMSFMVVVFLCLPIFGGASFLTYFPKLIMQGGITTANNLIASGSGWNSANWGVANDVALLPGDLTSKINLGRADQKTARDQLLADINTIKTANDAGFFKSLKNALTGKGILAIFIALGIAAAVVFILIVATAGIGFAVALASAGPVLLSVIWFFAWLTANFVTEGAAASTAKAMTDLSTGLWNSITVPFMDFIFINVLTFAFYGVIISCIVKAVIFCVTFPLSVVTMAFEQSRGVFISNIQRGLSIALTPLVAAGLYAIVIVSYLNLSASTGLVYQMLFTYIGTIPAGEPDISIIFVFFIRWLIATFVGPTVLCLPIARYILQAPKIATDLIGSGVSYGSGMSEKASKIGGMGIG